MTVRRAFVDFERGQVHYRHAGAPDAPPLVMLHASPGSSRQLEPLIAAMGESYRVIAPDTLGNGDSMPPAQAQPEIADYAEAVLRTMEALGLERVRLYGTHTGARIACHIALAHPERVERLILDGFGLYSPENLEEILATYAPEKRPDSQGSQVFWAWQFCRDQYLWFPWFRKEAAARVPHDLPSPEYLHARFVEIAKALTTYHLSYRAAFRYAMRDHVPRLTVPTLVTYAEDDLVAPAYAEAATLLPGAETALLPGIRTPDAVAATAARFRAFLG